MNVNSPVSREPLTPRVISTTPAPRQEGTREEEPLLAQSRERPLWVAPLPERMRSFTTTHPTSLPLTAVILSAAGAVSLGAGLAVRVKADGYNHVDHALISLAAILEIGAATFSMLHDTGRTSWTDKTKGVLTTLTLLTAIAATATAIGSTLQPTADERRTLCYTSAGIALPQVAWTLKEILTPPKISQQITDPLGNRSKDRAWMSYGLSGGLIAGAIFMLLLSNKDELSHFKGGATLAGAFTLSLALAATFAKRYSVAKAKAFSNAHAIAAANA